MVAKRTFNVSQSKVKYYRNCRQSFFYKHIEEIQPKRTKRPFTFGRIVHRMIEAEAQEEDPFKVLHQIEIDNLPIFTSEKEMYGEIITDIGIIMSDYFQYYNDGLRFIPVKDETGELRFAEHEFAIPLDDLTKDRRFAGMLFKGQVDGLGKTPNKLRWLVEHKSFDKFPGEDERWRNVQSVVYVKAVRHLGWMRAVDGVCWNYIKSHAPTIPQLLKDGSRLSVKEVTTLPSVVRATLAINKLDPELPEHVKLLAHADHCRTEYFQRIFTPINENVMESVWSGFLDTALEMREHQNRRDKNIGRHCSWCDYEPLCRAELTGGDVDFVKEREFQHEDPESYRRSRRSEKLKVVADGRP